MAEDVFGIVGSVQAEVFRVDAVEAEGGFGVVYRAHHQGFRAEVALKCLKIPTSLTREQRVEFLRRFQAEGELLFRLSALIPPIVRPLHVGVLESPRSEFVPFLALEWLEGETLAELVARRRGAGKEPLDLARAVKLLGPAARALERAHAFPSPEGVISVIHRDLKPENLFVARVHGQELVKILDFGLSKVKGHATQMAGRHSADDALRAFTPAYGAPEQWLPNRFGPSGPWTDVFGLALTLVETISGVPPFPEDLQAAFGACIDPARRPTPRTVGLPIPDALEAVFVRALAVEPSARFQTIGAFWDALERPLGLHTPRFGEGASALDSVVPPQTDVPPPAARFSAIPDLNVEPQLVRGRRLSTPAPFHAELSEIPLLGNDIPAPSSLELAIPAPSSLEIDVEREDAPSAAALASELDEEPQPLPDRPPPAAAQPVLRPAPRRHSRFADPGRLIGLAFLIMVGDVAYAFLVGATLSLGPVRPVWIAAPLATVGLAWLVWSLFRE